MVLSSHDCIVIIIHIKMGVWDDFCITYIIYICICHYTHIYILSTYILSIDANSLFSWTSSGGEKDARCRGLT